MLRNHSLLFNKAGDDGAGGSGGSGTGNAGNLLGGGSGAGAGAGAGNSGNGNSGGNNSGNNSAANQNATVTIPENWKMALPKELQESDTLKPITSFEALAKSYVAAQKLIGADKIAIPSKHATDADWTEVFTKLGVPKELKDYKIEKPKDASFDEQFIGQFAEAAHKAGLLPKQAQTLVEWFNGANKKIAGEMSLVAQQENEKQITKLQEEWGTAFKSKLAYANQLLRDFGGKDIDAHLQKLGIANDVTIVKMLSQLGEKYYGEDFIIEGGKAGSGPKTPDEAKKAITTMMGDASHPYHKKDHPGHKAAVEEMSKFYEMAYPKKSG